MIGFGDNIVWMAYASFSVRRQVGKHVFLNDGVVLLIYSALGTLFCLRATIEGGTKNSEAEGLALTDMFPCLG